jgi:hypothetical protein
MGVCANILAKPELSAEIADDEVELAVAIHIGDARSRVAPGLAGVDKNIAGAEADGFVERVRRGLRLQFLCTARVGQ